MNDYENTDTRQDILYEISGVSLFIAAFISGCIGIALFTLTFVFLKDTGFSLPQRFISSFIISAAFIFYFYVVMYRYSFSLRRIISESAFLSRKSGARESSWRFESIAEQQKAAILQDYIGRISGLILDGKLLEPDSNSILGVRVRALTLGTLAILDGSRRGLIIRFLHEAQLIALKGGLVVLSGADLSGINLFQAKLSAVDLSATDLRTANLRQADLRGCDLSGATLQGADLRTADLRRADLSGANLRRANLAEANLSEASLFGADLTDANLTGASLLGARLDGAILRGATLDRTIIAGTVNSRQLSQVRSMSDAIGPLTMEQ